MNTQLVIDELNKVLADTYALHLKTQNFHWNVVGSHFSSLHKLFEAQYMDLFKAIDEIAERIRIVGAKVAGNFSNFQALTTIKNGNENGDANDMLNELSSDQTQILSTLKQALSVTTKQNDEASSAILIDRISVHEKNLWILKSHLL